MPCTVDVYWTEVQKAWTWSIEVSMRGRDLVLGGEDLWSTKRDTVYALKDALDKGFVYERGYGWVLSED